MRKGKYERKTKETEIKVEVNIDGVGKAAVDTPVAFLSHMFTSLATHSMVDIKIKARGDLKHHIVEDAAICLGEALYYSLGDRKGITRFGYATVPMDDSLASAALDISGRAYSVVNLDLKRFNIEDCASEDLEHFFTSLASSLKANLHVNVEYGANDHHKVEAAFKALALALRFAVKIDPRRDGIPSSKGVI